jgi:hypothetical protein
MTGGFIHHDNLIKLNTRKVNGVEFKRLKIFVKKDLFDWKICSDKRKQLKGEKKVGKRQRIVAINCEHTLLQTTKGCA